MLDKIKSAYEMAMERLKQRREVPQTEIDRMEHLPIGKALAANFIREKQYDLGKEIKRFSSEKMAYVIEGAQETFLNNIFLPEEVTIKDVNNRAKEGLLIIKKDRRGVEEVFKQLDHLFQYYEQALAQTYAQFKESFTHRMSASVKSLEKRVGARLKIDPESQPVFREEWAKVVGRLNEQYKIYLDEQKEKLRKLE